jgi:phosphoribosylanthranilate isomerase
VAPELKFCGLTRPEDAVAAAGLGAAYAGVIFAGGPRLLTMERAGEVLVDLPPGVGRVGVFAEQDAGTVAACVAAVGLTVAQLHSPRPGRAVRAVREAAGVPVWAVLRLAGGELPVEYEELVDAADGIVVDALVPGRLGGTGAALDWEALAESLRRRGRPRRLVLAGGLRPENVARAVALVAPDVVDVSSGVEAAPGQKDHARMRAFAAAARGTPRGSPRGSPIDSPRPA